MAGHPEVIAPREPADASLGAADDPDTKAGFVKDFRKLPANRPKRWGPNSRIRRNGSELQPPLVCSARSRSTTPLYKTVTHVGVCGAVCREQRPLGIRQQARIGNVGSCLARNFLPLTPRAGSVRLGSVEELHT